MPEVIQQSFASNNFSHMRMIRVDDNQHTLARLGIDHNIGIINRTTSLEESMHNKIGMLGLKIRVSRTSPRTKRVKGLSNSLRRRHWINRDNIPQLRRGKFLLKFFQSNRKFQIRRTPSFIRTAGPSDLSIVFTGIVKHPFDFIFFITGPNNIIFRMADFKCV